MVHVRFAPSPTGLLHVGNARAALVNWLYAKKHNGRFMLRIDDTDLERSKPEYVEKIKENLNWLGLSFDSIVHQSKRFDRYDAVAQSLREQGYLYPCYETQEELDVKRKLLRSKGLPPIYDRAALTLSDADIKELESQGRKPHWRFKLMHEDIKWRDMIRGDVCFQGAQLSDPILIREDGSYLYMLPSVIDDLDFNITHIFRGEDHVSNTAIQLQIMKVLNGGKTPAVTLGHTTLLTDKDGQNLSKRLGSLSLEHLKEQGIEPMAINSHLARLGTSLPVEPVLEMNQLVKSFDTSIFSRTAPRFDDRELHLLNQKMLPLLSYEEVMDRLKTSGKETVSEAVWHVIKDNIESLDDVQTWINVLDQKWNDGIIEDVDYIKHAYDAFTFNHVDEDTWGTWTKQLKVRTGRKGKQLFMPLRQALTGMQHGPEMKKVLPLLGLESIKNRLQKGA